MKSPASNSDKVRSFGRIVRFAFICSAVLALVVWMVLPPIETLTFRKYDAETDRELAMPFVSIPDVGSRPIIAFSTDGQSAAYLATRASGVEEDAESQIEVIDVKTATRTAGPLGVSKSRTPPHIAFSHDGNFLAAAGATEVRVWDLRDSRLVTTLTLPDVRLQSRRYVAISRDGKRVATSIQEKDEDSAMWVFDTETGNPLQKLERTSGTANDDPFVFHPTQNQLIGSAGSPNGDSHLCVWDAETGKVVHEVLANEDCQTLAFALSSSDDRIAIAMYHGSREYYPYATTLFELDTWAPVTKIDNGNYVFWLALSPDQSQISLIDGSGDAALWSTSSGIRLQNFRLGLPSATAFSLQDGGLHLVTNSKDKPDSAQIITLRASE